VLITDKGFGRTSVKISNQRTVYAFFMIGNIQIIVQQQLVSEGRSVAWLCRKMLWQRKKYYRFFHSGLIEIHDLYRLSVILNHNFFQYFSFLFDEQIRNCGKLDTDVQQKRNML
jgi:hypothetical protein